MQAKFGPVQVLPHLKTEENILQRLNYLITKENENPLDAVKSVCFEFKLADTQRIVQLILANQDKFHLNVTTYLRNAAVMRDFAAGVSVKEIADTYLCSTAEVEQLLLKDSIKKIRHTEKNLRQPALDSKYDRSAEFVRLRVKYKEQGNKDNFDFIGEYPADTCAKNHAPSGMPGYLVPIYESQGFSRIQEQFVFRKYNFIKHIARSSLRSLSENDKEGVALIISCYKQAAQLRDLIVSRHLKLCISLGKRFSKPGDDISSSVSDASKALIRAVDTYDFMGKARFNTYLTHAVYYTLTRSRQYIKRDKERFPKEEDKYELESRNDFNPLHALFNQDYAIAVEKLLSRLNRDQRKVVELYYGINQDRPLAYDEIAMIMGTNAKAANSLFSRAMTKLISAAIQDKVGFPFTEGLILN